MIRQPGGNREAAVRGRVSERARATSDRWSVGWGEPRVGNVTGGAVDLNTQAVTLTQSETATPDGIDSEIDTRDIVVRTTEVLRSRESL